MCPLKNNKYKHMKNIVKLVVVMLLFSTALNAQNRSTKKADFTPEQRATLQTKKMTLNFDLDKNQQKSIYKMMLKNAEERKIIRSKRQTNKQNGTTPTQEERFNFENARLDRQLAHKKEMKNILTTTQFEKWEKRAKAKIKSRKERMSKKFRGTQHKIKTPSKQWNKFKN